MACGSNGRTWGRGACRRGRRSSPAGTRTRSSRCGWRVNTRAAPTTPRSAPSGRRSSARTATTPPRSASGTPALTQAWVKGPGGVPVTGTSGEKFGDESRQKPKTHEAWVQQVNECVLSLDEGVGQVMAALKESGQLENTLVVFSADQGFAMGEHGFRTKLAPYDANYASPLVISRPGTVPKGKACPHPVNAPDLVVTFFRHAGIELPWSMHGRDITPLL